MKDQTPSKAVVSTTGLHPHPRLFVGPEEQLRTTAEPSLPFLQRAAAWVVDRAEEWSRVPDLTYRRNTHNEFLGRAREVQTRVVTLLTRWQQTQDERFRRAVLDHIGMMGEWECWSWISWRRDDYRPEAIYDLSYGENSATLAIAYDWLFDTLSAEEKELCLGIALKWSFASATVHLEPGNCAWWYGRPDSNWNTVWRLISLLCTPLTSAMVDTRREPSWKRLTCRKM